MGETIVCIHGMWGSGAYWANYKSVLEGRGYQVLTPTLRLHGGKFEDPPPTGLGNTSLLDYAADLEQLVRGLERPPVLLGHSMGGLLALILASRGLGRATVLLTPAWPAGTLYLLPPSVVRSFIGVQMQWGFWRKPHRQSLAAASYSMLALLPPEEQQRVYHTFCYESGRAAFEIGYWYLDGRHAATVDPARVKGPLLLVGARQDRITPVSVQRKVAPRYHAEYVELPGHAHWVVGEPGWQDVVTLVADWLQKQLAAQK